MSARATMLFLKVPNDSPSTAIYKSNQQPPARGGKTIFFAFHHVLPVSPFPLPGSPERGLWEAVQHLPQTAHHQNGVSRQSELAWPIKLGSSLPHRSLSLSPTLLLVPARPSWGSSLIENSGFYTNGLSRICNVAFL